MSRFPLYILSGGASRRFGGDKARAILHEGTMIEAAVRQFGSWVSRVTVVAEKAGKYEDLGLETIADLETGNGPLGGLNAALSHFAEHRNEDESWLLVSACDLLGLRPEWLETLVAARTSASQAVAFKAERWEPFPALVHVSASDAVQTLLAKGERSTWRLFEALESVAVSSPEGWGKAHNLNTREELEKLRNS